MAIQHEVGVSGKEVSKLLDKALRLSCKGPSRPICACALLLCAAELCYLIADDEWCFEEDKNVMLSAMRDKAKESAWAMFRSIGSHKV